MAKAAVKKAKTQASEGKVQARVLCATQINGTAYKPDSVLELDADLATQHADSLDTNEGAVAYALSLGGEVIEVTEAVLGDEE